MRRADSLEQCVPEEHDPLLGLALGDERHHAGRLVGSRSLGLGLRGGGLGAVLHHGVRQRHAALVVVILRRQGHGNGDAQDSTGHSLALHAALFILNDTLTSGGCCLTLMGAGRLGAGAVCGFFRLGLSCGPRPLLAVGGGTGRPAAAPLEVAGGATAALGWVGAGLLLLAGAVEGGRLSRVDDMVGARPPDGAACFCLPSRCCCCTPTPASSSASAAAVAAAILSRRLTPPPPPPPEGPSTEVDEAEGGCTSSRGGPEAADDPCCCCCSSC